MSEKLPEASPDYFLAHGASSPAEAAELARQAGWQAPEGASSSYQPASVAPPARAPLSPAQEAGISARAAELQKQTGTDAATARSVAEQEFAYRSGSAVDRSVMRHQMEAPKTEQGMAGSIDAGPEPAKASYEYTAGDQQLREIMFGAGVPRALGTTIASQAEATRRELSYMSEEEVSQYVVAQDRSLRNIWGPAYESRMAMVNELLEQAARSPEARKYLQENAIFFTHWTVVQELATLAESQRRLVSAR